MRPTNLNFRSPKERTPEYHDPQTTYDGRKAKLASIRYYRSTFSKEPRFMQYKFDQQRTNVVLSPSTYNTSECINILTRKPCQVLYVNFEYT